MAAKLTTAVLWQGTDPYLLARVMKADGSYDAAALAPADVDEITYEVFNKDTGASLADGELTPVATYVLAALNTGDIWTVDDTGFNFVWIFPRATLLPSVTHRVEVTLLLTSEKAVVLTFELTAKDPAGD